MNGIIMEKNLKIKKEINFKLKMTSDWENL